MTSKARIQLGRMATISEMVAYWSQHEEESGLSVDWAEAHERCWACARKKGKRNFERCHIIPSALGGSNSASNLVLLCPRCHKQAPNVSDPSSMWFWLRSRAVPLYGTEWIMRGLEEFEKLYGRKPFANLEQNLAQENIISLVSKFKSRTIIHFGEGKQNPSTVAWIFAQIEKESAELGDGAAVHDE
jgi:hypothetical protein